MPAVTDAGEVEEEEDEEEEEKAGDAWLNELNPESRTVVTGCMANIHLAKAKPGDKYAACSSPVSVALLCMNQVQLCTLLQLLGLGKMIVYWKVHAVYDTSVTGHVFDCSC